MTSPTRFHPKQPPSTDRRRRRGAPRPSCAHLWSRRARSRHLPCVAKRYGPSSAVACLSEAVAFVGLLLPFSGLPAAFWGSRHCAASLGVRGSLVSIPSANLCRRHNRPPAKPGLLLASVSTDASALFFSCVFCASSFFCWRLGIAAGAAGIRLGCHLGPSAVLVYVLDARGVRNTGQQYAAPGRQRGLLFLGAAPGWVFLALYCSGTGRGGV